MLFVASFALAALFSTACARGRYVYRDAALVHRTASHATTAHGFVAGGGSISWTRTAGPYGPVSGVIVEPGRTVVVDGYAPYGGYAPPGTPGVYGPYGYGAYGSCSGAVACGSSASVSVERRGVGVGPAAPPVGATIVITAP